MVDGGLSIYTMLAGGGELVCWTLWLTVIMELLLGLGKGWHRHIWMSFSPRFLVKRWVDSSHTEQVPPSGQ